LIARILARKIAQAALAKKASNVLVMDLRKLHAPADYFVVCSADSDTHVKAIADGIRDGLEAQGVPVWHQEGYQSLQWVLLDYVDVVVHVFHKEIRSFYSIERLWRDASFQAAEDTPSGIRLHKLELSKKKTPAKPKRVAPFTGEAG
ncbi:MAG TPA: ribosome silencing factor, partial [Bacteroidota bacterium]|nr:ribosome silencing factor [Bacteroidota bacterium]